MKMSDFIEKIKRYLEFNKDEVTVVIIATLIIGFVAAFKEFSLAGLLLSLLIVLLSILFHVFVQKAVALHIGYSAEFKIWWWGLLAGLAAVFATNGKLWWLIFPGGIGFSMLAMHRLGKFRYGLNYLPMGIIAFSGPIGSIVLGTIFKNIELYIIQAPVPVLHQAFMFNLVYAVCSMLPIPPLDGHYLFYASRMWYALLFGTILAYTIMTLVFGIYSWIWALVLGGVVWLIYYISFERKAR